MSVRAPCAAARPVARLQDCVRAVCNKYARASGPEKIYHKQEGRQSAHGRKRMEKGVRGGREGGSLSGKRNEEEGKGYEVEMGGLISEEKGGCTGLGEYFLLGLAMFPIM